ncbi:hypothetical protein ACQKJG_18165 [Priestia megaterium]|uniref:hypothetical protein n=1 Tax=Priestia megaterium TaxID=1404 RepID=UPI003D0018DE
MKLSENKIKTSTFFAEQTYNRMKKQLAKYEADSEKQARLEKALCTTCYYLKSSIAGQAFTKYNCQHCGEEHTHPNTNVPKYCFKCSKEHNACKKCGASKGD